MWAGTHPHSASKPSISKVSDRHAQPYYGNTMYLINIIEGTIALVFFRSKRATMSFDQARLLQKIYRSSFGPLLLLIGLIFFYAITSYALRGTSTVVDKISNTVLILGAMYSIIWSFVALFTVTLNIIKLQNEVE